MRESTLQKLIQLAVSDAGSVTFRNNCGMLKNEAGIPIKFGVGNPGGSDLLGITPVVITQDMVGQTIGVFTAIEVKTPTGRVSDAQHRFIQLVNNQGGRAGVARCVEDALAIVRG